MPAVTPIETARLTIRALTPRDADAFARMLVDREVMRHIGSGVRSCEQARAEAAAFADGRLPDPLGLRPPLGLRAVEDRASGEFCGFVGLLRFDGSDEVELAYRLARRHWGRGIATEAAAALVTFAFADLGLSHLVAVTSPANSGSQRVLAKLGFDHTDTVRAYGVDGCLFYRLSATRFTGSGNRPRSRPRP